MKLQQSLADAPPTRPAFDALRASLHAAQSTTPTALASSRRDRPHRQVIALCGLLGELALTDEKQSWLHGSFYTLNRLPDE